MYGYVADVMGEDFQFDLIARPQLGRRSDMQVNLEIVIPVNVVSSVAPGS